MTGTSGLVVYQAHATRRVLRSSDLANLHGATSFGAVPEARRRGSDFPVRYLAQNPLSRFAEGSRMVRAELEQQLAAAGKPMLVSLTSAVPEEGKTALAIALAHSLAVSGRRCLLVDADLRRRGASQRFGLRDAPVGLATVLLDDGDLDSAIHRDPDLGLAVLPAGSAHTPGSFSGPDLDALRALLGDRYEWIIVDGPPWTAVADAEVIASQADYVLLAARWNATPIGIVATVAAKLAEAAPNRVGVVITRVDLRSRSRFSDKDAEYYSYKNRKYYETA